MQKKKSVCLAVGWILLLLAGMCGCAGNGTQVQYLAAGGLQTDGSTRTDGGQLTDGSIQADDGTVQEEVLQPKAVTSAEALIVVHVCGAVRQPGVYCLREGARAYQAVEAAGGFLEDARTSAVNLADTVCDGQQIYVPSSQEEAGEGAAPAAAAADTKISINRAAKEELMQLPGIGEAKADAIIAYREAGGVFEKPEDIMLVPGIKEAAYTKLKDRITAD